MALDPEVLAYYDRGEERGRLAAEPSLELVRTPRLLLDRYLPPAPARILDVGGGAGVRACVAGGPRSSRSPDRPGVPARRTGAVPLAASRRTCGDAHHLPEADASWDAVLLLGPLYHLVERADRVRALAEARRVCRPGGVVLAAAISRYASTFDGFFRGFVDELRRSRRSPTDDLRERRATATATRRTRACFTTAYFHSSQNSWKRWQSGLAPGPVLPVEGMLLALTLSAGSPIPISADCSTGACRDGE